jgi:hypothetical protein
MFTKYKPQQQRVRQLLSTPMLSLLSTLWLQGEAEVVGMLVIILVVVEVEQGAI